MHYLTLRINGVEIQTPNDLKHLNPTNTGLFGQKVIALGIEILFVGAILFALFFLIWGGVLWIRSEGDKQKIQLARDSIVYSVIGLAVVLLAFILVFIIGYFFNIELLGIPGSIHQGP